MRGLAFPDFDSTTDVDAKIAEIEKTLEGYLSSRREALDPANRSRLQLVTSTASRWYREVYPFARTLLGVAKDGAEVSPLSNPYLLL